MFIKYDIYKNNIFDIICDLSINLLQLLKIYNNNDFTYLLLNIKDLMIDNVILEAINFNDILSPTAEKLIELNNYYNIINDFNIKLYNMKQSFKKKINLNDYDINIIFLIKQIYNYMNDITNLLSMLIIQPHNILIYKQEFNKIFKNHIATTIVYKKNDNNFLNNIYEYECIYNI